MSTRRIRRVRQPATGSLWIAAAVALPCQCGCSSGRVSELWFSEDRNTLAYMTGWRHEDVCVATHDGVRPVTSGIRHALSRDARWLAVLHWPKAAGTRLTVYELPALRSTSVTLPFQVAELKQDQGRTTYHYRRHGLALDRFDLSFAEPGVFTVSISDLPSATSDPGGEKRDGPQLPGDLRSWTWTTGQGWTDQGHPADADVSLIDRRVDEEESSYVFVIQPDRHDARRTVWVRHDGQVVELSRHNSSPLKVGKALVTAPVAAVPVYGMWWLYVLLVDLNELQPTNDDVALEVVKKARERRLSIGAESQFRTNQNDQPR